MKKHYQKFAGAGSCSAEEYQIVGTVENENTFKSDEFTGTMDSQTFWDALAKLAKEKKKFIWLVY